MSLWLQRMRGAVGMGLLWAAAWFGAGLALLLVVGVDAADVPFPLGFGMLGFFAGVCFSGVLVVAEGRRRFDQMSLPRFAGRSKTRRRGSAPPFPQRGFRGRQR